MPVLTAAVVGKSLRGLVQKIADSPRILSSERDLHYLFHDVICPADRYGIAFRWEWATKELYRRPNRVGLERYERGKPGAIDVVLLSAGGIPVAGVEFDFLAATSTKDFGTVSSFKAHLENDWEKLTNPRNGISEKFLAYFISQEFSKRSSLRREELRSSRLAQRREDRWKALVDKYNRSSANERSGLYVFLGEVVDEGRGPVLKIRALPESDWISSDE